VLLNSFIFTCCLNTKIGFEGFEVSRMSEFNSKFGDGARQLRCQGFDISVCRKLCNPWHSFLRCPTVPFVWGIRKFNPSHPPNFYNREKVKLFRPVCLLTFLQPFLFEMPQRRSQNLSLEHSKDVGNRLGLNSRPSPSPPLSSSSPLPPPPRPSPLAPPPPSLPPSPQRSSHSTGCR